MLIGLIDVDSKIPNLALMKISTFHKKQGDQVKFFQPLFESKFDIIYASKIFTFSKNNYIPKRAIKGGSAYNLHNKLKPEIEHIYPDYSLYNCDYAMGYISRGCNNKCPFCFTENNKILTDKGIKKISDIKIGDFVLANKDFYKVNHTTKRYYKGKGVKFNTNFNKQYTISTFNHKFPLIDSEIEIGNINFNDQLLLSLPKGINNKIDTSKYIENTTWVRKPILKPILRNEMLKEFCEISGWYLSEGHLSLNSKRKESYTVGFTLSKNEKNHIDRIYYLIQKLFGLKGSIVEKESTYQLFYYNKELGSLLKNLYGHKANGKFIKKEILLLKDLYISTLLKSYFKGDGSLVNPSNGFYSIASASVSYSLSLSIGLLLRRMGYMCFIEKRKMKNSFIDGREIFSRNITYFVYIRQYGDVIKLAQTLFGKQLKHQKKAKFTLVEKKKIIKKIENDNAKSINERAKNHGIVFQTYYRWKEEIKNNKLSKIDLQIPRTTKINNKEIIDLDCFVYNLTIDKIHKYNINGILTKNCIVPKKEGTLHKHADLEEFWKDQEKLMLLDNSLTDYKNANFILEKIRDLGIKLNLTQGFNIRTISLKTAKILSEIKLWRGKQWYIAWDNIHDEKQVFDGIKILNAAGIKNWKIMCYVLIGFNTSIKQDLYRINKLESIEIDPFVMSYIKNPYTRTIGKWCNRKQIFKQNPNFFEYVKNKKLKGVYNFF